MFTFVPHGSDIVEPFFDCSHPMRGVFMAAAGNLSDGCHWALQSTTRLGYHCIMPKVKVKGLNDVCRIIAGA